MRDCGATPHKHNDHTRRSDVGCSPEVALHLRSVRRERIAVGQVRPCAPIESVEPVRSPCRRAFAQGLQAGQDLLGVALVAALEDDLVSYVTQDAERRLVLDLEGD